MCHTVAVELNPKHHLPTLAFFHLELQANKYIDKEIEERYMEDAAKIKLLLLGAGESGKSTVFKQMKILYGVGFTEKDLKQLSSLISKNTITAMQIIIAACDSLKIEIGK